MTINNTTSYTINTLDTLPGMVDELLQAHIRRFFEQLQPLEPRFLLLGRLTNWPRVRLLWRNFARCFITLFFTGVFNTYVTYSLLLCCCFALLHLYSSSLCLRFAFAAKSTASRCIHKTRKRLLWRMRSSNTRPGRVTSAVTPPQTPCRRLSCAPPWVWSQDYVLFCSTYLRFTNGFWNLIISRRSSWPSPSW